MGRHLIVAVHGIRTYGHWYYDLKRRVNEIEPDALVEPYRYGYLSALGFLLTPLRLLLAHRFRQALTKKIASEKWHRVDIVAHSFGAYLVARCMLGLKQTSPNPGVLHTVIFAGAALSDTFRVDRVVADVARRIINDCSVYDVPLILSQICGPGMAGRVGIRGLQSPEGLMNRYFLLDHSGFFLHRGGPTDHMEKHWVPLLTSEKSVPWLADPRPRPNVLRGAVEFLLYNFRFARLPLVLVAVLIGTLYGLRFASRAQEDRALARSRQLVTSMASVNDPSLSLYLGVRAAELARPLPAPTELQDSVARALSEGVSYAVFRGLEHSAKRLAWSPDSKTLASASPEDNFIRLWDEASGKQVASLPHEGVNSIAWSPDSTMLVSAGFDNAIRVWDVVKRKSIRSMTAAKTYGGLYDVGWSPDGHMIVSVSYSLVEFWDAATGTGLASVDAKGDVQKLRWSLDGKTISVSGPYVIELWDPQRRRCLSAFGPNDITLSDVAWSPDGKELAVASNAASIQLWNPQSRSLARSFETRTGNVDKLVWNPNGRSIASVGDGRSIALWDAKDGHLLRTLLGHTQKVLDLAWNSDGTLASAGDDRTIRLWRPELDQTIRVLPTDAGFVPKIAWSPAGDKLAALGDSGIQLWDRSGRDLGKLRENEPFPFSTFAWLPDGATLTSANNLGTIKFWDANTRINLRTVQLAANDQQNLTWNPDRKILAASTFLDNGITLWDATNGKLLKSVEGDGNLPGTLVRALVWSPDGKMLASAEEKGDSAIFPTPDLKQNTAIRILDATTLKPLATVGAVDFLTDLLWSPDSTRLASAFYDGTPPRSQLDAALNSDPPSEAIRIWSVHGPQISRPWTAHQATTKALAWSPNGKVLASASADKTVRLWQPDGQLLRTLASNSAEVRALAWSPDGTILASVDDAVRLWPGNLDQLLKQAATAIRLYSPSVEDCRRYFSSEACSPVH